MFVKEKVVEDGAEMAKGVDGEQDEGLIIIIYVANDAVAVGDDAAVGVMLVYPAEFLLFVNLEMPVGVGR
jgi:hypothetical protein